MSNTATLNPETVFRLLSDPSRRYVLTRLDPGERTTVDELAREIGRERRNAADVDAAVRHRIEIALVHNHLPRLADHGVITYVPEERGVVLTDDIETLRALRMTIGYRRIDS